MSRAAFNQDRRFMSVTHAAEYTGISPKRIRQGCKDGSVPYIKCGRDFKIDITQWMEMLHAEARQSLQPTAQATASGQQV